MNISYGGLLVALFCKTPLVRRLESRVFAEPIRVEGAVSNMTTLDGGRTATATVQAFGSDGLERG